MSYQTQAALDEIKAAVAAGQKMIVPSMFSHFFGRAAASAAFRMAKQANIIKVSYVSCVGTPVYCGSL